MTRSLKERPVGQRVQEGRQLDAFLVRHLEAAYERVLAATSRGHIPCDGARAGEFACNQVDLAVSRRARKVGARAVLRGRRLGVRDLDTKREYAIVGLNNGVSVVDVTDPFEAGHVSGTDTFWHDVKALQVYDMDAGRWRSYGYAGAVDHNG